MWANLRSERYQTSKVMVSCNVDGGGASTHAEKYKVSLSTGKSNPFTSRKVEDNANHEIAYNVFVNPNHTGVFGDGTNSTKQLTGSVNTTTDDTFTIYAKMDATDTNPVAGSYNDYLTLSVDY